MNAFLLFNVKVALSLSALFAFYKVFLSANTLFKWNRYFLLTGIMVCILISGVTWDDHVTDVVTKTTTAIFHASTPLSTPTNEMATTGSMDFRDICTIIWLAGFVFQLIKWFIRRLSLERLKRLAIVKRVGGQVIYVVPGNIAPFAFGRSIFVPKSCMDSPGLDQIIAHESIHVAQWHTLDMLLAECCCCFAWYNPLVFQLRKSIRHNLEYLTDTEMLQRGTDRESYQYLLLRFSAAYSLPIGNKLNTHFLKSRIKMINQQRTKSFKSLVYFFFLPFILCLSLSFTFLPGQNRASGWDSALHADTTKLDYIDHIEIYGETGKGDTAYIFAKNGSVEKIFLKTKKDNIDFHRKFAPVLLPYRFEHGSETPSNVPVDGLPDDISEFTFNQNYIWLTLKNGTKEEYKLSDQKQRTTFERKYGKLVLKRE